MNISIGLLARLGKFGHNLYSYFNKSAKIDASLAYISGRKESLGPSPENSAYTYVGDAIFVFNFQSDYRLTLKNASTHDACNLRLLNSNDIFSIVEKIPQLTSLKAGESVAINCSFVTKNVHATGAEKDNEFLFIPNDKRRKELIIAYDNEARKSTYTLFKIDDREANNRYSLRKPT